MGYLYLVLGIERTIFNKKKKKCTSRSQFLNSSRQREMLGLATDPHPVARL